MHRFGSSPDHEKRPLYEGNPSRLLRQRQGSFFECEVTDPQHKEALFWSGGNHRTRWNEGNNPGIIRDGAMLKWDRMPGQIVENNVRDLFSSYTIFFHFAPPENPELTS